MEPEITALYADWEVEIGCVYYGYKVELNSAESMTVDIQVVLAGDDTPLGTDGSFTHTESCELSSHAMETDLFEHMGDQLMLVVTGSYERDGEIQTKVSSVPVKGYTFYSYCEDIVTGTSISFPVNLIFHADFYEYPYSEVGSYDFEVLSLDVEWFEIDYESGEASSLGGGPIENGPENVIITQTGTQYEFDYNGPSNDVSGAPVYGMVTMTVRDKNSGRVFTTAAEVYFVFVV